MSVSDCAQYTLLIEQMKKSEQIQKINYEFQVQENFYSII